MESQSSIAGATNLAVKACSCNEEFSETVKCIGGLQSQETAAEGLAKQLDLRSTLFTLAHANLLASHCLGGNFGKAYQMLKERSHTGWQEHDLSPLNFDRLSGSGVTLGDQIGDIVIGLGKIRVAAGEHSVQMSDIEKFMAQVEELTSTISETIESSRDGNFTMFVQQGTCEQRVNHGTNGTSTSPNTGLRENVE